MNNEMVITENMPVVSMDTETLRRELAAQITITAKALQRMGEVWAELERRGEDLSDLRNGGLYAYLPYIAAGRLRAELVVRYAGKSMLLRALSLLPVSQQDELLERGALEVVSSDDPAEAQMIPLEAMRAEHVRVAFGTSGLRPLAEQRRIVRAQAISTAIHKPPENTPAYIDIDQNYLKSGRKFVVDKNGVKISLDDIIDALSAHFGEPLREMLEERRKAPKENA